MKLPEITRRITRAVRVGTVTLGGADESGKPNPVVIQSMTNTPTSDVEATLAQIRSLARAGAELVRVAAATPRDTAALRRLVAESPVPLIADVHFHYQRALEAVAAGAAKLRLNPGNLSDADEVRRVIDAAGAAGTAIRVGVNEGSVVDRRDGKKHMEQLAGDLDRLMIDKMADYLALFEKAGFTRLVLSAKSHDAVTNIVVNRALARQWDYPLHLGVTHAGTAQTGAIRTAAALGTLLSEGIGETIRVSYAGDPLQEVEAAKELLASLRLRRRDGVELIACPTCGRLQMDLNPVIETLSEALQEFRNLRFPIQVAIMGCVVNGPGEAEQADVAVCAGKNKAVLYCHGQRLRNLAPEEIVPAVLEEVRSLAREG